jgi:hypothetical protein
LTIDSGWAEVAADVLAWLEAQGYAPSVVEGAEASADADDAVGTAS